MPETKLQEKLTEGKWKILFSGSTEKVRIFVENSNLIILERLENVRNLI